MVMISQDTLLRYEAYFTKHDVAVLYVEGDGDFHIVAVCADCRLLYNAAMFEDAIIQNLHPLGISHIKTEN